MVSYYYHYVFLVHGFSYFSAMPLSFPSLHLLSELLHWHSLSRKESHMLHSFIFLSWLPPSVHTECWKIRIFSRKLLQDLPFVSSQALNFLLFPSLPTQAAFHWLFYLQRCMTSGEHKPEDHLIDQEVAFPFPTTDYQWLFHLTAGSNMDFSKSR